MLLLESSSGAFHADEWHVELQSPVRFKLAGLGLWLPAQSVRVCAEHAWQHFGCLKHRLVLGQLNGWGGLSNIEFGIRKIWLGQTQVIFRHLCADYERWAINLHRNDKVKLPSQSRGNPKKLYRQETPNQFELAADQMHVFHVPNPRDGPHIRAFWIFESGFQFTMVLE